MTVFSIILGMIGLFMLSNSLVSNKAVPSLSEFMASTTASDLATTTSKEQTASSSEIIIIKAPRGSIEAEVASTTALLEKGLGGRASLAEDTGMLFLLGNTKIQGFWMKDMNFSLDIVWLDAEKRIIQIDSDVATSTYPDVYSPSSPADYVLEVNATDAIQRYGMKVGDKLEF